MRRPSFAEANMGALVGAIVGATGGLFAVGIAPAVIDRNVALLFDTPILGLICFTISGPLGWLIGGQLGPRQQRRAHRRAQAHLPFALG